MKVLGLPPKNFALGCVGAVVGGIAGVLLFWFLLRYGFYAVALPGAFLGIGAGTLVRQRSSGFAIACGISALLIGLLAEWRFHPFVTDRSLDYFISNLHQLTLITWILLAIGVFVAFRASLLRESDNSPTK